MNRLKAIASALASKGIDGILISDIRNIRYLSGFTGSSACLVLTGRERVIVTDFRYKEQAGREVKGFDIHIAADEMPKAVIERAKSMGISTLGFEATVTYAFYRALLRKGLRLRAVSNFVEDMRRVKDEGELSLIRQAIDRAEKAFNETRAYVRPGSTEKQIALLLEENLKKNGCGTLPFAIIVAAGTNSSMPHARPTDYRLKAGDLVVVDWGGEAEGYFSDMTRTLLMKGPDISKKKEMYGTVLEANLKAIGSVSGGIHARMVDKAARDVIKKAGYGDFFGHGTGHGVGLYVHELPRISRLGRESVKAGMVFTIEPGIYLPGIGGVRIEDMVLADKKGCRVLTSLPKELETVN